MTKRVEAIIKRRLTAAGSGLLFPIEYNHLLHVWHRLKAKMGMDDDPQFVMYALRHTCASRLIQRGVGLVHVQKWMGHKTIQMTIRYAHLAPQDLHEAAAVLEPGYNEDVADRVAEM